MHEKTVLITGATMGIGLATALQYGQAGAQTIITHRWGTADEDEIYRQFSDIDAPKPLILEADVSREEDTQSLMEQVKSNSIKNIDIFVSNAALAKLVYGLDDYSHRSLVRSIDYTAWPMWQYSAAIHQHFGQYPAYIIGVSSDGPDSFSAHYDFVAIAKAVLETMCRYMNFHLKAEGVRVNVVRSRMVPTSSFYATFGESFTKIVDDLHFEDIFISAEEVASVIFSLTNGLMDAIGGQVIMVDRGYSFHDNLMGAYVRSEHHSTNNEED